MSDTKMRTAMKTVYQREQACRKKKNYREIQLLKNKLIICVLFLLLSANLFGFMRISTMANEPAVPEKEAYYTSIEIQPGDSLWSIASRYADDSPFTTERYVNELRKMNQLKSDTIHAGHYLMIVRYK